jgi:septum formation protein
MNWILASASPRRRDILSHLGLRFTVRVADVDEQSDEQNGAALVEQLARRKALAVAHTLTEQQRPSTVVLAADTVVLDPDGRILGKPQDAEDARRMLCSLSGRTHSVVSGIAVCRGDTLVSAHEVTAVTFSELDEQTVARYVASGEPLDKAGAYGIQDTAALWVSGICGDYFNVVGLPVHRLEQLLREHFDLSLWTE